MKFCEIFYKFDEAPPVEIQAETEKAVDQSQLFSTIAPPIRKFSKNRGRTPNFYIPAWKTNVVSFRRPSLDRPSSEPQGRPWGPDQDSGMSGARFLRTLNPFAPQLWIFLI